MKHMAWRNLITAALLSAGVLAATSGVAHAQWAWKDANGNMVFSDRAPPSDIKPAQIIRRPAGARTTAAPAQAASAPAAASGVAAASVVRPKTNAEREAEFRRRQADAASSAKSSADEEARKKKLMADCDRSRNYLSALESGQKIQGADSKGERTFMEDGERARESARVRKEMADAGCK